MAVDLGITIARLTHGRRRCQAIPGIRVAPNAVDVPVRRDVEGENATELVSDRRETPAIAVIRLSALRHEIGLCYHDAWRRPCENARVSVLGPVIPHDPGDPFEE
jgi:hypothetical protein